MFVTRMALDTNRPETERALSNPCQLQEAIDGAFAGQQVRCLWRIEQLNHRMHLILFSPLRPTLGPAHQQFGYPGAFPSWETWSLDDLMEGLHVGQRLHFRLCASICPPTPQSESIHHMSQETQPYQMAWLEQRRAAWGFTYEEKRVTVLHSAWISWRYTPENEALTCHQVTFDGELTITDAELFQNAMVNGMGDYCKMGAGLMTVEPVHHYRYV